MTERRETIFATDMPAAAGHFPGNPIVPGAMLLARAIEAARPDWAAPLTVRAAKFLRPVRPGDRIVIGWSEQPNGDLRLDCRCARSGEPVLHATLAAA